MNKFIKYTLLRTKIVLKNIPLIFLGSIILIGISSLLVYLIYSSNFSGENHKTKVAIVGNADESYLGFGIATIKNFDSSKNSIEFIELSNEEEAKIMLTKNDIVGYVIIPDDFISSLGIGENKEIIYVSNYLDDSIEAILLKEITDLISVILVNSEKAIYGVTDFIVAENIRKVEFDYVRDMNLALLSAIFARDSIYDIETRGYNAGVGWNLYYFISINLFMILIVCMQSGIFIGSKNNNIYNILKSRGYSLSSIVFGEYLAYLISVLITTIFIYLIEIAVFYNFRTYEIAEEISRYIGIYIIGSIPVIIMFTSMYFLLSEFSDSFNNYIIGFMVLVFFAYAGAYFYPKELLPETIEKVSNFLPTNLAFIHMKEIVGYSYSDYYILIYAVSLLFLMLSIFVRKVRFENV